MTNGSCHFAIVTIDILTSIDLDACTRKNDREVVWVEALDLNASLRQGGDPGSFGGIVPRKVAGAGTVMATLLGVIATMPFRLKFLLPTLL